MRSGPDSDPAGTPEEGEMTLAFDIAALDEFANPQAVFADARQWSRYVGVVGDDPRAVSACVDRHGLQQDYEIGTLEPYAVLSKLKWEADTDRYVFVGSTEEDRELADYTGWEYVPVRQAAENAGWTLEEDIGVVGRVRIRLSRVSPW